MSELRDQMAAVLGQRLPYLACGRTVACRCYVKDAPPYHERQADALMTVVQPVLDQRDARIRAVQRLHERYRFAGDESTDYCAHCNRGGNWVPYPCPTLQALGITE